MVEVIVDTNARYRLNSAGFTLIEVMLAMTITAFVTLLAYNGLSASMNLAESHERLSRQMADIQLPLTVIERDIRHAVARPIIDEFGEEVAAMSGGAFEDYPLKLTRRGWDNPRGLPRGGLQRVRYELEDEELWRESWSVLDRVNEEAGHRRIMLLKGVKEISLQFLNRESASAGQNPLGGEWQDSWEDKQKLPVAVEISLDLEGFGEVKRIFGIPGANMIPPGSGQGQDQGQGSDQTQDQGQVGDSKQPLPTDIEGAVQ